MKKVITHSGSFHSDDVFAVATLQLHFGPGNVEVVRTRDEAVIATGDVVLDVGGVYDPESQRFDHHQNGAPVRDNGIPYAAFGLVWKHYGPQLTKDQAVADTIEQRLVIPIDATDNGISLFSLNQFGISPVLVQDLVGLFKSTWNSEEDMDAGFKEACQMAQTIIKRFIAQAQAHAEEKQYVESVYAVAKDKQILQFEKPVSSLLLVEHPEVMVIVCPNEEGNWTAAMVRKSLDSFETKAKFKEEWAGLRDDELAKVSGVAGAVFCHKARFLFVAKSKEGVVEAVEKVLGD